MKRHVPNGLSIDTEEKSNCLNPLAIFRGMSCCINKIFDQVIDIASEGKFTMDKFLREQEKKIGSSIRNGRILGVVLTILGFYLILMQIRDSLGPIALAARLEAIMPIYAITFVLALIAGSTFTLATIATAWIFYRPIYGLSTLICAAGIYYLTLICDW